MAHITPEDRRGDLGLFEHSLAKKGTKIQVYVKVLEIETGIKLDKSKTIGTIATKNSGKVLMSAHSGYSSGQKREDYCLDTSKWNTLALGDAFSDTEDEALSQEANTQAEGATVPPEATALSDILTPVTPAPRSAPRRPQSIWGKAVQWIPEDPDELLSSYKKKTPVYEFPGYNTEPRLDSTTPSQVANVRPVSMSSVEEGKIIEHDNLDKNEWEDLGDGLMICCKTTTNNNQGDNVKCEKAVHSSPTVFTSGNSYALSAYELMEDIDLQDYEVVERPRRAEEYPQNLPLYRPDRQSASCTNILRRLAPVGIARLERFRHQEIDDSDESVFKSRYSILNPKYKR
ncbi:hypothetical protein F5B21DRAFT_522948 [Xylaria acuta]|nr:hypothetical protein F5B21DRAFT_522948 [Xylaria acuta]